MKPRPAAAVVALAVGAFLTGCAGSTGPSSLPLPPPTSAVQVTGGSTLERELMRAVIQGLEPRTIRSVTISKSPPRWWSRRSAVDLRFTHLEVSGERIRPGWEDWIVAGAFGRRLVQRGLRGTITLSDDIDSVTGERIHPREFHTPDPKPASPRNARTAAASFRRASTRSGAGVLEARVGRPYGLAPSVTLQVRDPASFLRYRLRSFLNFYDRERERYEGAYLVIVDRQGSPVLETGYSTRMQAGSYWVEPKLDSCSPVSHGTLFNSKPPPPCPA